MTRYRDGLRDVSGKVLVAVLVFVRKSSGVDSYLEERSLQKATGRGDMWFGKQEKNQQNWTQKNKSNYFCEKKYSKTFGRTSVMSHEDLYGLLK